MGLLPELKVELLDAWAGPDTCTAIRAPPRATAAVTRDLFTRGLTGRVSEKRSTARSAEGVRWAFPGSREQYLRACGACRTSVLLRGGVSVLTGRYQWSRGVHGVLSPDRCQSAAPSAVMLQSLPRAAVLDRVRGHRSRWQARSADSPIRHSGASRAASGRSAPRTGPAASREAAVSSGASGRPTPMRPSPCGAHAVLTHQSPVSTSRRVSRRTAEYTSTWDFGGPIAPSPRRALRCSHRKPSGVVVRAGQSQPLAAEHGRACRRRPPVSARRLPSIRGSGRRPGAAGCDASGTRDHARPALSLPSDRSAGRPAGPACRPRGG